MSTSTTKTKTKTPNIYDTEVFPNYFSMMFSPVDSEEFYLFEVYQVGQSSKNQINQLLQYVIPQAWFAGYNSERYDDQILNWIIQNRDKLTQWNPDRITSELFSLSLDIVEENHEKVYALPFNSIDLMKIAVGNVRKSLKLVGVNLRWHNIQDLPLPFDEDISEDQIENLRDYLRNDVEMTKALYDELREKIIMRQKLSVKYGVNLMSQSRSDIGNRLLEHFYSKATYQHPKKFKYSKTKRDQVLISDCVSDDIFFKTQKMESFLDDLIMNERAISQDSDFEEYVQIGKTRYKMAKGGLHSKMPPEVVTEGEDYLLIDADVSSYYPNVMLRERIKPAHLSWDFLDILEDATETRLKAKFEGDKVTSEGLKISVNAIFGDLGFEWSWLYDILALYRVTLNGQLFLLMLIEWLEMENFHVFYGNTDGVTVKVPKDRIGEFRKICDEWQWYTEFDLEYQLYHKCIIRDVNNYLIIKKQQADGLKEKFSEEEWKDIEDGLGSEPKMKGEFDTERWKDLRKSFNKPVVPKAVRAYFEDDISIEEFIQNHEDILDFCMAQKPGSKFDIEYRWEENGELLKTEQQRTNRYFIGKGGGSLVKKTDKKEIKMVSGEPVLLLNSFWNKRSAKEYGIKYRYYIREAYKLIEGFNHKQTDLFS